MKDALLKTDPAAFEIVKNSLYKVAEEMRVVLAKTAYSPILKSAGDYSCGVFDAKGEMVAQGPDLPIHLGSMPDAVRAVVSAFGPDVYDGSGPAIAGPACVEAALPSKRRGVYRRGGASQRPADIITKGPPRATGK